MKKIAALVVGLVLVAGSAVAQSYLDFCPVGRAGKCRNATNDPELVVMTGGRTGTYSRFGQEMSNLLSGERIVDNEGNYQGDLRVTTVLGKGSRGNFYDLLYRENTDMGIVQADYLQFLASLSRQGDRNIRQVLQKVEYVTRLYDEELHILIRRGDNERDFVDSLRGKRLSLGSQGSGTRMTAQILLGDLGLATFENLQYSGHDFVDAELELQNSVSLSGMSDRIAALRDGKIDAIFYVAGKPVSAFAGLGREFQLLEIGRDVQRRLSKIYQTTTLTNSDYPELVQQQEINTIAVPAILVAYDFQGSGKRSVLAAFVRSLRTQLPNLKSKAKPAYAGARTSAHPKWLETDLSWQAPGDLAGCDSLDGGFLIWRQIDIAVREFGLRTPERQATCVDGK